ncbi:hypothetical protein [Streptomyces sp. NPDC058145]|uniref:hypothetical protein n=1 Tax=Streptomyces sp. NPDC058145 TaxID=3346356 RepID=UPI0036F0FE2C
MLDAHEAAVRAETLADAEAVRALRHAWTIRESAVLEETKRHAARCRPTDACPATVAPHVGTDCEGCAHCECGYTMGK